MEIICFASSSTLVYVLEQVRLGHSGLSISVLVVTGGIWQLIGDMPCSYCVTFGLLSIMVTPRNYIVVSSE